LGEDYKGLGKKVITLTEQNSILGVQCNIDIAAIRTPLLILLLSLFTACGTTVTPPPPVLLKVEGSTSMKPLLVGLTAAYSVQHPNVTFDIQGGGSQLGQRSVETGQTDIGMVSWVPPNLSDEVRLTSIARDAVAIILNIENQSRGLSRQELRDIFSGQLLNWQEVDGPPLSIQVVSREDGSGTRAVFEAAVMEASAVTPTAIVLPSSQAVVDFVAQNPNAIGYVSFAFSNDRVYAAPIEGVTPNLESLASGSYYLTRDLSLITPKPSRPEVNQFIEFVLSPTGQAIVEERWDKIR
jgi:phosphate transport system substrate-binding protein